MPIGDNCSSRSAHLLCFRPLEAAHLLWVTAALYTARSAPSLLMWPGKAPGGAQTTTRVMSRRLGYLFSCISGFGVGSATLNSVFRS
jgi:hypothetical protein